MSVVALLAGISVSLLVFSCWKLLGPGGLLNKDRQLKQRIFTSDIFTRFHTPSLEKIRHLSDVKTFRDILSQHSISDDLVRFLKRANLNISVSLFILSSLALGIVSFAYLKFFFNKFLALLAAAGIAYLPYFYLRFRNQRYISKFEEYLPNALSIISNSIKVGHGLETAVVAVAETAPEPVAKEFKSLRAEMKLGQPLSVAMQNIYKRIKSPELQIFVTGVCVHQELGGNLSEILDHLEQTMRERFALKREIKALSAQGVMSSWILFAMPIVVSSIWYATDPSILQNYASSEGGRFAIGMSIALQIIAFFWMRHIVALKS